MGWAAIFTYEAVRQVALLGGADVAERASGGAAALLQRRLSDAADEQRDAAAAAERRDEMRHAEEGITGLQLVPEEQSEEGDFQRISEYLRSNSLECLNTTRPARVNALVHGRWHHLQTDKHHVYMFSAFFDERQDNGYYPSLRILAVAEVIKDDIFCQVWFPDVENPVVKKAKVKKNGGGHSLAGVWYEQYYFTCHLDTSYPIPRHVSVVSEPCARARNSVPVYVPIRAPYQHEFGICVPVAFWSVDPYRLVEWVEAHRLLGVTEINVYHVNMTAETLRVLRHFEENDTILRLHELPTVPQYESTRSGNKIGSPISLNDCMYRNTYRYRWVIVVDFDEVIVPRKQTNYSAMVQHILKTEKLTKLPPPALTFRNTYFWTGCEAQRQKPNGSVMLRYLKREAPSRFLYAAKSIVDPRRCISVFNHYCFHRFPMRQKHEEWTIDVSDKVALSHHYREKYNGKKCKDLMKKAETDKTILRFEDRLNRNVRKQMRRLGFIR